MTSTIPATLDGFHRELIRQVQAEGFDVCAVSSPGPELDRVGKEMGIRVRSLPMTRSISPWSDLVALFQWMLVCLIERPEFVFSATPKASLLGLLAAKATRADRRLYYVGGLRLEGEKGRKRGLLKAMERLTGWAATDVVANSPSLLNQIRKLRLAPDYKLRQTQPASSHGVNGSYFSPQDPDREITETLGLDHTIPVIGFVGRLTHDKGVDTLIEAMGLLQAEGTACQLLLVGPQTEPDSAVYLESLRSMGRHVIAVGEVHDVRPYFALMNVHVLPSLREGFPNVVLEASAMGLPTVTTDATGAIDSVRDGETGIIVKTQDPRALAVAIRTLTRDPDMASRYGIAARNWVIANFHPQSVVRSLLAFGESSDASSTQHIGAHECEALQQ